MKHATKPSEEMDKLSNAMKLSASLHQIEVPHLESENRAAEAARIALILSASPNGEPVTAHDLIMMQAEAQAEAEANLRALPKSNLGFEKATDFVMRWSNSYTRMEWAITLRSRMEEQEWHSLLGYCWSCTDNLWQYKTVLRNSLGRCACPMMSMMTDEEQDAYGCLEQKLDVYRGCSARHLTGPSWTLDPEVARNFPTMDRFRVPDPVLIRGSVNKRDVLALLLEREESEIVSFKVRRISVERLAINN